MLKVSENTIDALQGPQNTEWVKKHVEFLMETAAEDVVYHSKEDLYTLVERMLIRAESIGLRYQETTSAFCYSSLKLGIGFEVNENYPWAHKITDINIDDQADYIWQHLHDELGSTKAGRP